MAAQQWQRFFRHRSLYGKSVGAAPAVAESRGAVLVLLYYSYTMRRANTLHLSSAK